MRTGRHPVETRLRARRWKPKAFGMVGTVGEIGTVGLASHEIGL